jgi:MYXO-CTERM domain-containing protein
MNSMTYVPQLQEATSKITDSACTHSVGCIDAAKPAGELGAGGMGIDTCPGDSGGPLYIDTPFGMFVAGLTSRGYDDAMFDCSEGGLYVRPDKIVDWIEEVTQVKVSRGPEPTAEAIDVAGGAGGETLVVMNDPKSTNHTFEVTKEPTRSRYAISDEGRIRVCADGAGAGTDELDINVVDADHIERSLPLKIKINVSAGTAATDCSLEFDQSSGCGCQSDGNTGLGLLASLGVLGLLTRRRRTA